MPPADITLTDNAIGLKDGNVTIDGNTTINKSGTARSLTVGGTGVGSIHVKNATGVTTLELASNLSKMIIRNSSNVARIEFDASAGRLWIRHSNGVSAVELSAGGLILKNSSGSTRTIIPIAGGSIFYEDITLSSDSDIKLDGQWLASRLDNIESRLTAGGL
jgi:hypothetical protein